MGAPVRTLVAWCPDWPVVSMGRSLDEPVAVVFANRVVAVSPGARSWPPYSSSNSIPLLSPDS